MQFQFQLIILLMIATMVALVTWRLRTPYVTGLVLAGLPITELLSRRIGLDPALVLNLFLPILIFEAAINPDITRLRNAQKSIIGRTRSGRVTTRIFLTPSMH